MKGTRNAYLMAWQYLWLWLSRKIPLFCSAHSKRCVACLLASVFMPDATRRFIIHDPPLPGQFSSRLTSESLPPSKHICHTVSTGITRDKARFKFGAPGKKRKGRKKKRIEPREQVNADSERIAEGAGKWVFRRVSPVLT